MITKIDREYILSLAKEGKREDGRGLSDYRDIKIDIGVIGNAEGSARVLLGDTEVVAGVKLSIMKPFPDAPDEGTLMVSAELGAKASPEFELGPPKENAIEVSRVIDRGIRESKSIDLEKLAIESGEKVWSVSVDIDIINDGGNIMDVAGIAAISALLTTKIPKIEKDGSLNREDAKEKLPVREIPIPVTTHKLGGALLLDVNHEEEAVSDCRITVTSIDKFLCAMQKGGEGRFKSAEVLQSVEAAFEKAKEIRKAVKAAAK